MLSVTAQYALKAMLALARLEEGQLLCAPDIAARVRVPANYLSKLLKQLAREGLLVSQKGQGGGFRLARPASSISLLEVVTPLENAQRLNGCLLGTDGCDAEHPCPAHEGWKRVRDQMHDFLRDTTLSDLVSRPVTTRSD